MSCLTCSNCGFLNFPPPEPQLKAIQNSDGIISEILRGLRPLFDSDHALINAQIEELERLESSYNAQLQEIQLRHHTILKALENRKSIYAPIRRLPRDIVIEIIHSVCDSWWQDENGEEKHCDNSLDMAGPIWVLGRVCGLWRDTVYISPVSWARNILVRAPFSKHACEIWKTYLKQTGQHPLSMRISLTRTKLANANEIMSLLVQSCQRWKNLYITSLMSHTHHPKSISHLPVLQTFQINIWDDSDDVYRLDMCLNAPQLWKASLSLMGIHQVQLPLGITHYSGRITCAEDLQLLSQLPKLRVCHFWPTQLLLALIAVPVIMTELCQLYVDDIHALKLLTAPRLQRLSISAGPSQPLSDLIPFFCRSGCHLKSLGMCLTALSSASIRNIFLSEACFTISHFKIELDSRTITISNALAPPSVLPNLHHLVLCFMDPNFSRREQFALLDMIRSRRDTGLLKTIEVQFYDDLHQDNVHGMEADIRVLTGDNLKMRVEQRVPLYLDHLRLFYSREHD
ncbi:uncharacterized protein BT62DRAFT_1005363 [Guyanagaster necrorhizus]|uniref:F-box domain-containing protein n=1 Tax=Guyanagaster necrorhizus TaxID=856835 RepID=A0A9P7VW48_9AGAR|nr:uncharacterized protein BT62DRAFT_1005363 [Guyanagaster necrorhizus MCA 3950]KAG7446966.1 hypothetical protein BT62DRAFT_1005363 [Guyanagaster necrorhizus MCA 3950]